MRISTNSMANNDNLQAIELDMAPENSWDASKETGDAHAPFMRRIKTRLWSFLPIEPVL